MNCLSNTDIKSNSYISRDAYYDLTLIKRISEENTSALDESDALLSKQLYTIKFYLIRDVEKSDKLLQELYLRIWEKVNLYDETLGDPLDWITCITRNKSQDRIRSENFTKHSIKTDIEKFLNLVENSVLLKNENNISLNSAQIKISKSMKVLIENQTDLIEFAYFKGYSKLELSEHYNISFETVNTKMRSTMLKNEELRFWLG